MTRDEQEQAIATDLNLCDLVEAIGSKKARAEAKKQRAICMRQIRDWNREDRPEGMSIDDLYNELTEVGFRP